MQCNRNRLAIHAAARARCFDSYTCMHAFGFLNMGLYMSAFASTAYKGDACISIPCMLIRALSLTILMHAVRSNTHLEKLHADKRDPEE